MPRQVLVVLRSFNHSITLFPIGFHIFFLYVTVTVTGRGAHAQGGEAIIHSDRRYPAGGDLQNGAWLGRHHAGIAGGSGVLVLGLGSLMLSKEEASLHET